jgi:predicted RNA-binding Zn-ribbon protein involved in translation (DUF1610 family)
MEEFPNAIIREAFDCKICGDKIEKPTSSVTKYCPECAELSTRYNRLKNVRRHNAKKKKYIEAMISMANTEHGITLDDPNSINRQTRIDSTHTAWDWIPHGGQKVLGTMYKNDLNVTKNGRIKAAVKLEREIKRMRKKRGQDETTDNG